MELVELDFNRTAQALGRTGWERGSHLFASTDPEENETGIEGGADAGLTVGPSGSGPGRGGCERALRPSRLRHRPAGSPRSCGAARLGGGCVCGENASFDPAQAVGTVPLGLS